MARKTERLTISQENRDKGKTFIITEMSADKAERWAIRAITALMNDSVSVPPGALNAGMAAIAAIGLNALSNLDFEVAEPLLAEMMSCVKIDMGNGIIRELLEGDCGDIEEVVTRLLLRKAVLELHLGFSLPAIPRTSESAG